METRWGPFDGRLEIATSSFLLFPHMLLGLSQYGKKKMLMGVVDCLFFFPKRKWLLWKSLCRRPFYLLKKEKKRKRRKKDKMWVFVKGVSYFLKWWAQFDDVAVGPLTKSYISHLLWTIILKKHIHHYKTHLINTEPREWDHNDYISLKRIYTKSPFD